MSQLTILVHIHATPDNIETVEGELKKLIPTMRAAEGCAQYDVHNDNTNPAHFVLYENWTSRELWQANMSSPHLTAYMAATEGKIAAFDLFELTVC